MNQGSCRSCGSTAVRFIGELRASNYFAGRHLPEPLKGGHLLRCISCHLVFRHPILTDREYASLYSQGAANAWTETLDRIDVKLIQRVVRNSSFSKAIDILDIGCNTGDLLASLSSSSLDVGLYGIEPGIEAARVATHRGVKIIGGTVEEVDTARQFDAVIACDIIEHMPDPYKFLCDVRRFVRPGGKLLISTGNADAWLWRLAGADFWYCGFPEHISFIGAQWLARRGGEAGFRTLDVERFRYLGSISVFRRWRTVARVLLYAFLPRLYRLLRKTRGNDLSSIAPLGGAATADHVLMILTPDV